MPSFRSFRLRIALLTAVVAGIVFGLFSIVAYSTIHGELEKNVDTRVMVEARQAFGRGIGRAMMGGGSRRERATTQLERQTNARPRQEAAGNAEREPDQAPGVDSEEGDVESTVTADPLEAEAQIFACSVVEVTSSGRKQIDVTENWPEGLATDAISYGEGAPIAPTEVTDLLRGRRSRLPDANPFPPKREPRRETQSDSAAQGGPPRGSNTAAAGGGSSQDREAAGRDGERRPGERSGRSRGRWRGGLFLTQEPHFHNRTVDGEDWRVGVFVSDRHEVIVAASLSDFSANVQKLRSAFGVAIPAAVLLIALGAWMVSGQAIRPIRRIADTAESVTAAGLSQRIAEPGTGDELQRLTVVLNRMLDRLEDGFKQATRFSADASHELKTPLTIMQGELEAALREAPPSSAEQGVYASQLEEVTRLKRIVSSLLLLSRADAGQLNLTRERIDVSGNFAAVCEDAEILADAAEISLKAEVTSGLTIMGDRALLQQVFQNLISNAVKYNEPGGAITCTLEPDADGKHVVIDIENTGDGIPEDDQAKVFRRFHRADAARGREIDGFGLGLNLALEIARAHSGDLTLVRSNSEATLFRLKIPLA